MKIITGYSTGREVKKVMSFNLDVNGQVYKFRAEGKNLRIASSEGAIVIAPTASNVIEIHQED